MATSVAVVSDKTKVGSKTTDAVVIWPKRS